MQNKTKPNFIDRAKSLASHLLDKQIINENFDIFITEVDNLSRLISIISKQKDTNRKDFDDLSQFLTSLSSKLIDYSELVKNEIASQNQINKIHTSYLKNQGPY